MAMEGVLSPATTALRRYEVGEVKKGIAGGEASSVVVFCRKEGGALLMFVAKPSTRTGQGKGNTKMKFRASALITVKSGRRGDDTKS